MNENRLTMLNTLESVFNASQEVCNPVDYIKKQTDLLYVVSNFILEELREYESEEAQKNSFATMKSFIKGK